MIFNCILKSNVRTLQWISKAYSYHCHSFFSKLYVKRLIKKERQQKKLHDCKNQNLIKSSSKLLILTHQSTLYNVLLRIARILLVAMVIIIISTHPCYPINFDRFSWGWSKFFFFEKNNSRWPTQNNWDFQLPQFSIFFRENLNELVLRLLQ